MSRVLAGQLPSDGSFGLYISQSGYEVTTATPAQMAFDSRYGNYGSIIAEGSASCGATINFATMSYIPMAYVYIYSGSSVLTRQFWSRAIPASEANSYTGGNDAGDGYVSGTEYVQEPAYKITTSSLYLYPTPYQNQSGQSEGSYTARYTILRAPGGS